MYERHKLQSYVHLKSLSCGFMKQYSFGTFHTQAETVSHVGIQVAQAGACWNAMRQHAPTYYKCISQNNL